MHTGELLGKFTLEYGILVLELMRNQFTVPRLVGIEEFPSTLRNEGHVGRTRYYLVTTSGLAFEKEGGS